MMAGTEMDVLLGFCLLSLAGHQLCFCCSEGYVGRVNVLGQVASHTSV